MGGLGRKLRNTIIRTGEASHPEAMKSWYVDASLSSSGAGDSRATAFLTITEAVAAASAYETIYIVGTVDQDDGSIASDYSESVTIAATQMGLRIIGLGNSPEGVLWTVGTAEGDILTVNAKDCYVSGIRFRPNGSTSGTAIKLVANASLSTNPAGFTVENCTFRSTVETCYAAIAIDSANDVTIKNNKFTSCGYAVFNYATNNSICYRMIIEGNYVDDKCTNGFSLDGRSCYIVRNMIGVGLTMTIKTNGVGAAGKENIVYDNVIPAAAYETNAAGYVTDCWLGNKCIDVGNTDVNAAGDTLLYPNQA